MDREWEFLKKWENPEPTPDFRARFWKTVVAMEKPGGIILPGLLPKRLVPVFASLLIVIFTGLFLVKAHTEKINIARDMELYQNLDTIENMELLADLEFIIEENS